MDEQPAKGRAPWQLAASSGLTVAAMSLVGATGPELREHLDVGTSALTIAFVAQLAGALAGSWLSPRLRGAGFQLTAFAVVVAIVLAMLAPTLPLFVAAMALVGLGSVTLNTASQAEVMRRAGAGRARALSAFHVWGGAGGLVFPLLVTLLLAADVSWHWAFVLAAAGYLAIGLVNRDLRVTARGAARHGERPPLTARACWAAAITVVGGALQIMFTVFLATLAVDDFDASHAMGTTVLTAFGVGVLGARLATTLLLARFGPHRMLLGACAALGAGYVLLAIASSAPVVAVAALLLGVGAAPTIPLGMARASREIHDDGYASAVVFAALAIAQGGLPGLVALLLQAIDLQSALLLSSPLAVLLLVAVLLTRERPPGGLPGCGAPLTAPERSVPAP